MQRGAVLLEHDYQVLRSHWTRLGGRGERERPSSEGGKGREFSRCHSNVEFKRDLLREARREGRERELPLKYLEEGVEVVLGEREDDARRRADHVAVRLALLEQRHLAEVAPGAHFAAPRQRRDSRDRARWEEGEQKKERKEQTHKHRIR